MFHSVEFVVGVSMPCSFIVASCGMNADRSPPRIPIACSADDIAGTDRPARARLVLDDDRLTDPPGRDLGQLAGDHVGRASGGNGITHRIGRLG